MSQSVLRALDLLTELSAGPATLDELASRSDAHKTTVMRILHTLESRQFVVRDNQGRYRLGSQLFRLSSLALEQRDIRSVARPHLTGLNTATGHTVHLAALEGDQVVYIDKLESRQPVRMYSRIGLPASLHSAAVSKVLLADLPRKRVDELIRGLDYAPATRNTITSQRELLAAIDVVREEGWAIDAEEHEEFVHCIGAPIRGADGVAVAAISVSVPVVLLDRAGLLGLLPQLLACAHDTSAELGYVADVQPIELDEIVRRFSDGPVLTTKGNSP